jgi:hypothetical protein
MGGLQVFLSLNAFLLERPKLSPGIHYHNPFTIQSFLHRIVLESILVLPLRPHLQALLTHFQLPVHSAAMVLNV